MSETATIVPIAGMIFTVFILAMILYYRNERAKHTGGGDYQKLAEEALRGQRVLLEEVQRMNTVLKEIERLLREV